MLTLRPVDVADLDAFYVQMSDPLSSELAAVPTRPRSAFDAHWAQIMVKEGTTLATIVADGTVAGHCVCFGEPGARDVGYWIDRAYWGRGYASEALRLFLEQLPDRPLKATVAAHNRASMRVLEKNGFTIVGEPVVEDDGVTVVRFELTV
jgi:RimJ/RimL family protein N-acetyltransferase